VTLRLPPSEFAELPSALQNAVAFAVHVTLFTQGVNEAQTLANATGQVGLQDTINLTSLQWLEAYASEYADALAHPTAGPDKSTPSGRLPPPQPHNLTHNPRHTTYALQGRASRESGAARSSMKLGARNVAAGFTLRREPTPTNLKRPSFLSLVAPTAASARLAATGGGQQPPPTRGLAGYVPAGGFVVDGTVYLPMEATDGEAEHSDASRLWELRLLLAELRSVLEAVNEHARRKETRVLTLSAHCVRLLGGGRLISCKSGKDRTSMSVTADQVELLQRYHALPAQAAGPMLTAMRGEGCRMENTLKNVGKRGYAFNSLQRLLLPASLRPAAATTLAGLQS